MLFHFGNGELRDVIEARHIHVHHGGVVFRGVFGERLADVNAGVVHQRVDPAELRDAFGNDTSGGCRVTDITGNRQDVRIVRWLDRTRGRNNAVVELAKRLDDFGANALRCAGNDDNLL